MANRLFKSNNSRSRWPFHKVLIANRGEIAVRIIRTCRVLGLATVAVYSTTDAKALHVKLADEAVCIGPGSAEKSYLNISALIGAALVTGADAVHPGFGFLSESVAFSRACQDNDLTFIGPSPETIALLGDKEAARLTMRRAGLPLVKGSQEPLHDLATALAQAEEVGYPVMLKAAAGGGGKGMRIIRNAEEMEAKFAVAQDEARASFNDDQMYLEQYLAHPRHIEVQVIGDQYGNALALGERDCTIQARHQKVIEEAPAAVLPAPVREAMLAQSEQAAAQLKYEGLGTIEFLYNEDGSYYFMEMNTRIQVEHTVTEMVTGIDLVKAQLVVAAGEALPFAQADIKAQGVAIECRINAEDPKRGFFPSTGKVTYLYLPVGNLGMRIDTALYPGVTVSPYYDSMVAKVIAHGNDRQEAISRLRRLLNEMVITGITTNQNFHLAILNDPVFNEATFTTNYLEQEFLPRWKGELASETLQGEKHP